MDRLKELRPEALNTIPLLKDLSESEKNLVVRYLHVSKVRKNETVVVKSQPSDKLYFLISGRLKIVDYSADGREVGFVFVDPGAHFGELGIIDGRPRSASVVTTEDSILAWMSAAHAREIFFSFPGVSEKLLKQLVAVIRQNNHHIVMLGNISVQSRVCSLLLGYAKSDVSPMVIEHLPTQSEIAMMINTSRETVSRVLNQLSEKGILSKQGKKLVIHNPDMLKSLVN